MFMRCRARLRTKIEEIETYEKVRNEMMTGLIYFSQNSTETVQAKVGKVILVLHHHVPLYVANDASEILLASISQHLSWVSNYSAALIAPTSDSDARAARHLF
jgi:hypothetical protein